MSNKEKKDDKRLSPKRSSLSISKKGGSPAGNAATSNQASPESTDKKATPSSTKINSPKNIQTPSSFALVDKKPTGTATPSSAALISKKPAATPSQATITGPKASATPSSAALISKKGIATPSSAAISGAKVATPSSVNVDRKGTVVQNLTDKKATPSSATINTGKAMDKPSTARIANQKPRTEGISKISVVSNQTSPKGQNKRALSTAGFMNQRKMTTQSKSAEVMNEVPTSNPDSASPDLALELGVAHTILTKKGYEVLNRIGSGTYARVYKVRNLKNNKELAVKIIDLTKTSEKYRVRFLPREMRILQQVHHKNIIRMFEMSQSQKRIFIFMELAQNGTVADFLKQYGAIPEYISRPMFANITEALAFMHSVGVAHRDMKIENILLDKNLGTVMLQFSLIFHLKAC